MKVEWSKPAVRAVQNIRSYIAKDSAVYADAFAQRLIDAVWLLRDFPRSGRVVPEADDEAIREIVVAPYRIIYRVRKSQIEIVNVVHGGRDLSQISPKPWEK